MPLWKIEVYENTKDADPAKTGYVNAATEDDAVNLATNAMGDSNRADIRVVEEVSSTLPPNRTFWAPDNA